MELLKEILTLTSVYGAGVAIVLFLLGRFLPDKKLEEFGVILNNFGEKKIGKVVWKKIEDHLITHLLEPIIRGLRKNDKKNGGR